jgi:Kef-type K+ transport system membrane component KefB
MATALSITALPVIAKTLMDLNLYRSDLGMLVVAAAVFNDLVGWIIFAVILGMLGTGAAHTLSIGQTIWLTLGFALGMLTVGRWLIHRILPWIHAHLSWPGGVLGFALSLALVSAAFTEWIGIHAIFGAFLAGVAGDQASAERTATIEQFVSFISPRSSSPTSA